MSDHYLSNPGSFASWMVQDIDAPNRFIAYGALVGGPFDQSGVTYQDRRLNFTFVEPGLEYSSGLVGAIAAGVQHYGGQVWLF